MKAYLVWTVLLLSGCATLQPTAPTQLDKPDSLKHNDKSYYLIKENDLGPMARYFYVGKGKTASNWQSAVELLLDRSNQYHYADRIALRKKVYSNQGLSAFDSYEQGGFLYSYVIYSPTAQNPNWQLDVAKGKDVAQCGFIQYQYSLKVDKDTQLRNMDDKKIVSYLKKYAVDKEMRKLYQSPWHWACQKPQRI